MRWRHISSIWGLLPAPPIISPVPPKPTFFSCLSLVKKKVTVSFLSFTALHPTPHTPQHTAPPKPLHPHPNKADSLPARTFTLGIFDLISFILHKASTPPYTLHPHSPSSPSSPTKHSPHAVSFSPPHTILLPSVGTRLSSFHAASPFFTGK